MKRIAGIIFSLAAGGVITLITGLLQNPFYRILDVVHYGLPFSWIIRVIPKPSMILWDYFIQNVIFWSIVVYLAMAAVAYFMGKRRRTK